MPEKASVPQAASLPPAEFITHQHVVAIINTLLAARGTGGDSCVRVLDLGSGDGKMLVHLLEALPRLRSDLSFEVHGLDVVDAGQQDEGFMDEARTRLEAAHPGVDWRAHLSLIASGEDWPYPDAHFDFITSNQVMEHVVDHSQVFAEIARCLKPGGVSVNLFPIREVLWEGHALMPIVHRIKDVDRRARFIAWFARLGFTGHYHREMERRNWKSLAEFGQVFARVLETDTNYRTEQEFRAIAAGAGLDINFDYTKDFYLSKLRSFWNRRSYLYQNIGLGERMAFHVCKRIEGVTLLLHRRA